MLFNPINTNHESSIISFSYPKHIIAHITGLTGSKKYFLSVLFEINSCMTGKLNASFAFMPKLTFSLLPQDFTGFLMKENKKNQTKTKHWYNLAPLLSSFLCLPSSSFLFLTSMKTRTSLVFQLFSPGWIFPSYCIPHTPFLFHLPLPFLIQHK